MDRIGALILATLILGAMSNPQVVTICLMVFCVTAALFLHGTKTSVSFWKTLISAAFWSALMYWGGFW